MDQGLEIGGPSKIKRFEREVDNDDNELNDLDDDYMKVRVYLYNSDLQIKSKLFTDEWYMLAQDNTDSPNELKKAGIPFVEVSHKLHSVLQLFEVCFFRHSLRFIVAELFYFIF